MRSEDERPEDAKPKMRDESSVGLQSAMDVEESVSEDRVNDPPDQGVTFLGVPSSSTGPSRTARSPLKLQIPAGPPEASSSSASFTSRASDDHTASSPYNDVSPFPSPLVGPQTEGMGLLKIFNGQSPPVSAISRSSSLRMPHGYSSPVVSRDLSTLLQRHAVETSYADKRIVSEYVPVAATVANTAQVARLPGTPRIPEPDTGAGLNVPRRRAEGQPDALKGSPMPSSAGSTVSNRSTSASVRSDGSWSEQIQREPPSAQRHDATGSEDTSKLVGRVYEAYDSNRKRSTWREVSLIGRGAFSRVVLAKPVARYVKPEYQSLVDSSFVAIKIVNVGTGTAATPDRIETRLRREIDILKKVDHPSLICLHAFNMDATHALLVLPYCPGGDLFDLASRHRDQLRPTLVRRIFAEVVRAVAYLHHNNIVHRDIKLENILLNPRIETLLELEDPLQHPEAIVTLTDLGLSRQIDPLDPSLTTRCGSEDYVPPEILMGQPYDGRQTDSWALGVVLYAIMEGRLPFDPPKEVTGGRARGRTAHRIARVEWSWIHFKTDDDATIDDTWVGAKEIVEGCLQKRDKRLLASNIANLAWVSDVRRELSRADTLPITDMFIEDIVSTGPHLPGISALPEMSSRTAPTVPTQ